MHPESALCSCSHLGLYHDRRQRYVVPDSGHRCHCRSKPQPISLQHQAQFCLHPGHYRCPALVADGPRRALSGTLTVTRFPRAALGGVAALLVVSVAAAHQVGGVDWVGLAAMLSGLTASPAQTVVGVPATGEENSVAPRLETPAVLVGQPSLELVEPTPERFPRLGLTPAPTTVPTMRWTGPSVEMGQEPLPSARLLSSPDDRLTDNPMPDPGSGDKPASPGPPTVEPPAAKPPAVETPTPGPQRTPTPTVAPAAVKTPLGQVVSAITRRRGPEVSEVARGIGLGDAPKLCPGQNLMDHSQASGKVK